MRLKEDLQSFWNSNLRKVSFMLAFLRFRALSSIVYPPVAAGGRFGKWLEWLLRPASIIILWAIESANAISIRIELQLVHFNVKFRFRIGFIESIETGWIWT